MIKISHLHYLRDKKKLYDEFTRNPERSVKEIAKKYGFSKQKVYKIKREFKTEKKQNDSIVNILNDNFRHFIIILKTSKDIINNRRNIDDFEIKKDVEKMKVNINFCYITNGDSDCIMGISSKNISEIKIFCNRLKQHFYNPIQEIKIIEILKPLRLTKYDMVHNNN